MLASSDVVAARELLMLREARQLWQLLHGEDNKVSFTRA